MSDFPGLSLLVPKMGAPPETPGESEPTFLDTLFMTSALNTVLLEPS